MESYTIDYKITETTTLQFLLARGSDYYPKVIRDTDAHIIPLIVAEDEIPRIIKVLNLINFYEDPVRHISDIVAGCISTLIKST